MLAVVVALHAGGGWDNADDGIGPIPCMQLHIYLLFCLIRHGCYFTTVNCISKPKSGSDAFLRLINMHFKTVFFEAIGCCGISDGNIILTRCETRPDVPPLVYEARCPFIMPFLCYAILRGVSINQLVIQYLWAAGSVYGLYHIPHMNGRPPLRMWRLAVTPDALRNHWSNIKDPILYSQV